MRLAVLTSHPIQYYAPVFRELATLVELEVFFAHKASPAEQAAAGFGTQFDWDVDLMSGYSNRFLQNKSRRPGTGHFSGCDTPEISDRLREGRFDALLVLGWHLKSFLQGILAAKKLGLPVLVRGDSHLGTPRSPAKAALKRLAYPPLLRLFDGVLYVGQQSRAYYEHYGYPADRLTFSPHCVDTNWFAERATVAARDALRQRLGIAPDVFVTLFAGRLLPFKRPLDVVAAAALCRARGQRVEVMIAGDGALREALADEAAKAGVPLHLLGFCNQTAMPAAYAAADALVLPSEHETWGLVANEALACGRPVAVSDACGCAADLVDGRAVRSFAVGHVAALADAMSAMITAPPMAAEIVAISAAWSLQAAAQGILAGLTRALARKAGPGVRRAF